MLDLILLRHGQSVWNAENLFTGWEDVGLSEKGEDEAVAAGRLMAAEADLDLRILHTSVLGAGRSPPPSWPCEKQDGAGPRSGATGA